MLGEIVHNRYVVDQLLEGGFEICEKAEDCPEGSIVIVRAHGVTPDEIEILKNKTADMDMTCPFASKIHKIVRDIVFNGNEYYYYRYYGHPGWLHFG